MTHPLYLLAEDLQAALQSLPEAVRVEIAGSVRREKPDPKDLELCALVNPEQDLFGEDLNRPTAVVRAYLKAQADSVTVSGPKYTQYIIRGMTVDYFQTADPLQWGMLYFIRTGPAHYVKFALTEWKRTNQWKGFCKGNILFRDYKQPVATPSEEDVFRVLGWQFQEPKERI